MHQLIDDSVTQEPTPYSLLEGVKCHWHGCVCQLVIESYWSVSAAVDNMSIFSGLDLEVCLFTYMYIKDIICVVIFSCLYRKLNLDKISNLSYFDKSGMQVASYISPLNCVCTQYLC